MAETFPKPPKIEMTYDYSIFVFREENRKPKKRHIDDLRTSFRKYPELLPHRPQTVYPHPTEKGKFIVIEGQHSIKAAEEEGFPVYYTVMEGGNIRHAAPINATQKNWRLSEYLHHFRKLGFGQYERLHELLETYPVKLSVAIPFLNQKTPYNGISTREFKDSKFSINHEKEFIDSCKELLKLSQILKKYNPDANHFVFDYRFFHAYVHAKYHGIDKLNAKEFRKQVEKHTKDFLPKTRITDYLRMIENIHNIGKSKNRIRLF